MAQSIPQTISSVNNQSQSSDNLQFQLILEDLLRCKKAVKFFKFVGYFALKFGKCTTKQANEAQWGDEFDKACCTRTIRRYLGRLSNHGLIEVTDTGRGLIKKLTSLGYEFYKWLKSWKNQEKKQVSDQVSDRKPPTIYKNQKKPIPSPPPKNKSTSKPIQSIVNRFFKNKEVEYMSGRKIKREVYQQIEKHFSESDVKTVCETIYHIESSIAYKILLIETVSSSMQSMRSKGESVENLGAFINFKHKELLASQDEENMKSKNQTDKIFGFDRAYLESNARVGESYYNCAKRLRGDNDDNDDQTYNPWSAGQPAKKERVYKPSIKAAQTQRMIEERDQVESSEPPPGFFEKLKAQLTGSK